MNREGKRKARGRGNRDKCVFLLFRPWEEGKERTGRKGKDEGLGMGWREGKFGEGRKGTRPDFCTWIDATGKSAKGGRIWC